MIDEIWFAEFHLDLKGKKEKKSTHRLQAISAQTYGLAISSSGFKLLPYVRDCARRLAACLTSSGGRASAWVGRRFARACSRDLLLMTADEGSCGYVWDKFRITCLLVSVQPSNGLR